MTIAVLSACLTEVPSTFQLAGGVRASPSGLLPSLARAARTAAAACLPVRAAEAPLAGNWKMVMAFGPTEVALAILQVALIPVLYVGWTTDSLTLALLAQWGLCLVISFASLAVLGFLRPAPPEPPVTPPPSEPETWVPPSADEIARTLGILAREKDSPSPAPGDPPQPPPQQPG